MGEAAMIDRVICRNRLLDVLCQVGVAHVASTQEGVVHGEGSSEAVLGVTTVLLCKAQIVLQHGAIVGVCHLDEFLSLLHVALATQVCHTILSDNRIDEVVGMVDVAGKGHNAADGTALLCRATGEDTQVGIVGEVGTAAQTVHHLGAADLGAVDVAIDIAFDGGIQRAYTDTCDNLGAVAYL